MRYAIFTDIHANLEALEAVLAKIDEIAAKEPIDQIWFLGDLVGYGPDPNECIRVLRERTDVIIAGNHDWAAVGKIDLEDFSAAARVSAEWTAEQLTPEYRDFLAELPERLEIGDCTLVHGSPFGPLWEYLTSEALAERSFLYFDTRYCLVGHTHVPAIFIQPDTANIPTVPLASSEPELRELANGAVNHHEQVGEGNASAESNGTDIRAGALNAAGETADDETVELVMIPSQGQQSTLAAAQGETTASAHQEPRDSASDSTLVDDETVTVLAAGQDDVQENEGHREGSVGLSNGNGDSGDDETVIAPVNNQAIRNDAGEQASGGEVGEQRDGEDGNDVDSLVQGNEDDVVVDDEDEAGDIDTEDEDDRDDGRTPASEIESAEERLANEIEELLSLLGLSQSIAPVTNQMLTPPEGHWEMSPDHRAIINPGGVGQPRDGDPRAAFMIYDTERGFEFYRVPYDFEKTQEKIINAGLPHFLAVRLAYGR